MSTFNEGWFAGYKRALEAIVHMLDTPANGDELITIRERVCALKKQVEKDERDG